MNGDRSKAKFDKGMGEKPRSVMLKNETVQRSDQNKESEWIGRWGVASFTNDKQPVSLDTMVEVFDQPSSCIPWDSAKETTNEVEI